MMGWVTMICVFLLVTMIVLDGLLLCVYDGQCASIHELCMKGYYEEWVTVVYGSYEQVAILGAVSRFLTAVGYCRK